MVPRLCTETQSRCDLEAELRLNAHCTDEVQQLLAGSKSKAVLMRPAPKAAHASKS